VSLRDVFLLRDDVVFLNHGSFGACPRPVFEEYQRLQRELEGEPVDFLHPFRTWPERMAGARAALAAEMGCDRDELVYVSNTTVGLNVVARSVQLAADDEVLTCDHEYGAMDRTWRFLCEKSGARYVRQELPIPLDDPQEVVEAVWAGVTDRTKVLFLSHITSPTGVVLPVAELIGRARLRGILTIIDGAHVPGQLALDLHGLGADFYAGNCHKWLMAPKGAAFLYARRDVQDLVEPLVVSWGWRSDHPGPSRFIDEQEWTGTRDPAAQLAVPAALKFCADHDWPSVRHRCHKLLLEARAELLEITGLEPLCPAEGWLLQMATLPLPPLDPVEFEITLRRRFQVEVPVFEFAGRPWLRVSIQGYNERSDIETLARAVRTLLNE